MAASEHKLTVVEAPLSPAAVSTSDFIDSLFNILTFFQTSSFVGNMIVGAGIVTLLVDFVKIQRRDRISVS